MSPTPNPRINTGWRTNTLAEKTGHRHRDSELDLREWRPSDGYVPRPVRDGWTFAQLFCATVALGAAVVVIALEVAPWLTRAQS